MTRKPDHERKPEPTDLNDSEWDILQVVWRREPCTAGDVQEELESSRGWAYSTVKTLMERMVAKGLLSTHNIRNLKLFTSCVTKTEARQGAFRRLLSKAFDGAVGPMMEFLVDSEQLSTDELDEIKKSIARNRKKRS